MAMPTEDRQYSNPPLREALVEFRFTNPQNWSTTVPGVMYMDEKIKARYDGADDESPAPPAGAMLNLNFGPNGIFVNQQSNRTRFQSKDGTRRLLVGRDALSVHVVGGYPGWVNFVEEVGDALNAHTNAMRAPRGVNRIGVRYINHIPIPSLDVDFADYLSTMSPPNRGVEGTRVGYSDASEYLLSPPCSRLIVKQSAQTVDGAFALFLDIDAIADIPEPMFDANETMDVVNLLHDSVVSVFKESLTAECEESFND